MYYNPDNRDVAQVVAEIDWVLELEKRDWGIKNVLMYPEKINISVVYEDEDMNQFETTIDVSDWNIENNLEIKTGCPQSLELDFKRKEITIS